MQSEDLDAAVALQSLAFPPPFSPDLLWDRSHLQTHITKFPKGQLVAVKDNEIVGTCSNTLISEERWQAHQNWVQTVGGPNIESFDPNGTTLYGLDITVHPNARKQGIGRMFYNARYKLVTELNLTRYGTGCRLPGYRSWTERTRGSADDYAKAVASQREQDRVLTPLLRYSLSLLEVIPNYMEDEESLDNAALLEWRP